jgi:hypothetical protein
LKILLSGTFHGPSHEDLAGLIHYGGGLLIENAKKPEADVIIVCDTRSNEAIHYEKNVNTIITGAWILDCISCFRILPFKQYLAP